MTNSHIDHFVISAAGLSRLSVYDPPNYCSIKNSLLISDGWKFKEPEYQPGGDAAGEQDILGSEAFLLNRLSMKLRICQEEHDIWTISKLLSSSRP